jgi:hypothetical protein
MGSWHTFLALKRLAQFDLDGEGMKRICRMVKQACQVLGEPSVSFEDPWGCKFNAYMYGNDAFACAQDLANLKSLNGQHIWSVMCDGKKVEPTV